MGKMSKEKLRCEDCGYFQEINGDYEYGECRHDKPIAEHGWPHVVFNDWCGDFEPIDRDIDD